MSMSTLFKKNIKIEDLSEDFKERLYQVFGMFGTDNYMATRMVGGGIEFTVAPDQMGALIGYKGFNIKEISKYFWNKPCRAVPPIIIACYNDEPFEKFYVEMAQLNKFIKGSIIVVDENKIKKMRHISGYSIYGNRTEGWVSQWEALAMGIPYDVIKKYKEMRQ